MRLQCGAPLRRARERVSARAGLPAERRILLGLHAVDRRECTVQRALGAEGVLATRVEATDRRAHDWPAFARSAPQRGQKLAQSFIAFFLPLPRSI